MPSGGTTAPSNGSLRQMTAQGMPTRTGLSTGTRTVGPSEPIRGPLNRNIGANIGATSNQRGALPSGKRQRIMSTANDLAGVLVGGASFTQKSGLNGDGTNTSSQQAAISRYAPGGQTTPSVGTNAPDMARGRRNGEGLAEFAGMPGLNDDFIRGQTPSGRMPGTGGIGWAGFPQTPNSIFDLTNTGGSQFGYRGTAGKGMTIDIGDRSAVVAPGNGAFAGLDFSSAAQNAETKSKTGAPNAIVPYTHRISDEAQEFMPEEQKYMLWFTEMSITDPGHQSGMGAFLTKNAHVPFHTGHNLVVMNMQIAAAQKRPEKLRDVVRPEDILADYGFSGPVRVDVGAKNSPLGQHEQNRQNRNLVLVIEGPGDTFNLWKDPKYGQELYLILKGVPRQSIRAHKGAAPGTYNYSAATPGVTSQLDDSIADVVLQFVPWNDPTGYASPSLEDLAYEGAFGETRHGVAIRLGKMLQRFPETCQESTRALAPYSVAATMNCGRVRIDWDVQRSI